MKRQHLLTATEGLIGRSAAPDAAVVAQAARRDRVRALKTKLVPLGNDLYSLRFCYGPALDTMQVRFSMTLDSFRIQDVLVGAGASALGYRRGDVQDVATEMIHRNWSAWIARQDAANGGQA